MMAKSSENVSKNRWILESKIEKNRINSASKINVFFGFEFLLDFGGIWRGLERFLGALEPSNIDQILEK